mmetsp:Transcript_53810/g.172519  ORF Transcript_53810/g.172519 Transcript_53810/m.172519 type:complete len:235 (-) Transcript_53810:69-773(-)
MAVGPCNGAVVARNWGPRWHLDVNEGDHRQQDVDTTRAGRGAVRVERHGLAGVRELQAGGLRQRQGAEHDRSRVQDRVQHVGDSGVAAGGHNAHLGLLHRHLPAIHHAAAAGDPAEHRGDRHQPGRHSSRAPRVRAGPRNEGLRPRPDRWQRGRGPLQPRRGRPHRGSRIRAARLDGDDVRRGARPVAAPGPRARDRPLPRAGRRAGREARHRRAQADAVRACPPRLTLPVGWA